MDETVYSGAHTRTHEAIKEKTERRAIKLQRCARETSTQQQDHSLAIRKRVDFPASWAEAGEDRLTRQFKPEFRGCPQRKGCTRGTL